VAKYAASVGGGRGLRSWCSLKPAPTRFGLVLIETVLTLQKHNARFPDYEWPIHSCVRVYVLISQFVLSTRVVTAQKDWREINMLKTVNGKEIDPKEIDYTIRGGVGGNPAITGVIMKDGTEEWLKHTHDEVVKAMNNS